MIRKKTLLLSILSLCLSIEAIASPITTKDNKPADAVTSSNSESATSNTFNLKVTTDPYTKKENLGEFLTQLPTVKGEALSKEESMEILKNSYLLMNKVNSYELYSKYIFKNEYNQEVVTDSEAIYNPKDKKRYEFSVVNLASNPVKYRTYNLNGTFYYVDKQKGIWSSLEPLNPPYFENTSLNPEIDVLEYITVEKYPNGYIIRTSRPSSYEELNRALPFAGEIYKKEDFQPDNTGEFIIILDGELKFREAFFSNTYLDGETKFLSFISMKFVNYNSAKEIEITKELQNYMNKKKN